MCIYETWVDMLSPGFIPVFKVRSISNFNNFTILYNHAGCYAEGTVNRIDYCIFNKKIHIGSGVTGDGAYQK